MAKQNIYNLYDKLIEVLNHKIYDGICNGEKSETTSRDIKSDVEILEKLVKLRKSFYELDTLKDEKAKRSKAKKAGTNSMPVLGADRKKLLDELEQRLEKIRLNNI